MTRYCLLFSPMFVFAAWSDTAAAAPSGLCELAMTRGGLTEYEVDVSSDANGEREVQADLDGDGINDKITWFVPGSASIIPPDNTTLKVSLSSTGKTFTLEEQRLHVVKYQSSYLVITHRVQTEWGPWHSDVYEIVRTGMNKVCSLAAKASDSRRPDLADTGTTHAWID